MTESTWREIAVENGLDCTLRKPEIKCALRVQCLRLYVIPVNTKEGYKYNTPIRHTHVSSPRDFIRFIESGKISNSKLSLIIYSSL